MNSLTMRCAALALCATTLAACGGGGGGTIPLGGAIYGLNRTGLVLENKGKELVVADSATSFTFPDYVANDAEFEILVKTNPPGQTCTPSNNKGRANAFSYQQTRITCTTEPFVLSGTVSGLTGAGLVLANGSQTVAVKAGDKSFTFGKTVPNGQTYGITVLSQPAGQSCYVVNAAGTMPMADQTNVQVICN
jgi:hypothetical protein